MKNLCECIQISCCGESEGNFSPWTFSLVNGASVVNSEMTFIVDCPPNYSCAGPTIRIVIPPGFIRYRPTVFTGNPPAPGDPWTPAPGDYQFPCGNSNLSITVGNDGFTAAQTTQIINALAACNGQRQAIQKLNPVPTATFTNEAVFVIPSCLSLGKTLEATGPLPSWITIVVDGAGNKLAGRPGTFSATTKAAATAAAQTALQNFFTASIGSGLLICTGNCFSTGSPLPSVEKDTPYSTSLSPTLPPIVGDPYVFSITAGALPAGLTLNSSTGGISGTPTTAEVANFTAHLSRSAGSCEEDYQITVTAPAFDCMGNAGSISAAAWTQGPFGGLPPCDTWAIAAGTGTFSLKYNLTTCIDNGMNINTILCNPGAPYDITVTMPWDDSGNVAVGVHIIQLQIFINGNPPGPGGIDTKDLVTGPFTPFVVTATIPSGSSNTIQIQLGMLATPSPEVIAFSDGNLTITPLTPP